MARAIGVAVMVVVLLLASAGGARAQQALPPSVKAYLVPLVGEKLGARLSVGRVSGALPRFLVLEEVALSDDAGRPRVTVERIAAELDVRALLRREVHVLRVVVTGVRARGRIDAEGRLDLVELIRRPPAPSGAPSSLGVAVRVDRLAVIGRALVEVDEWARLARGPLGRGAAVAFAGEAAIAREGERLSIDVKQLTADVAQPARGQVAVAGGVDVVGGRVALRGVEARVAVDGAEVGRAFGAAWGARLRGAWAVRARADGRLEALSVAARVVAPRGGITATGSVARGRAGRGWRGRVVGSGLDPAAAFAGAPRAVLAFAARGEGRDGAGEARVERLRVAVTGARAEATGRVAFGARPAAEGAITIDVAELAALRFPGVHVPPELGGRATARAEGRWAEGALTVDARLEGERLRAGATRVGGASARVALDEAGLRVIGRARGIVAGAALRLDEVALAASGDGCAVAATVDARGPRGLAVGLAVNGRPIYRDGEARRCAPGAMARIGRAVDEGVLRPRGVALTIGRLAIARNGQRWRAARPGRLRVEEGVVDGAIALRSGVQELDVEVTRAARGSARGISGEVRARGIDLARVAAFAGVVGELPATCLSIDARGELDAARVRGSVVVVDRGARVEADVDGPRAMMGGARRRGARYDGAGAIAARLTVENVVLERFTALLPPSLRALRGRAEARLRLSGRVDAPTLTGDVTLSRAGLGPPVRGRADELDLVARLQGRADALAVWAAARYGDAPLVTVDATLRAPFARALGGAPLAREAVALSVDARVPSFDLARLGAGMSGVVTAVANGRGTLAAPTVTLNARGDRVRAGELLLPLVTVEGRADRALATVALEARSVARPAGSTPGRLAVSARVPLGDATGALDATLRATGFAFSWGGVRGAPSRHRDETGASARASGVVDGELTLTGTRERPIVRGRLAGRDLGLAIAALGRPLHDGRLRVELAGDALVLSELAFASGGDGRVTARGRASLDGMRPTTVEATLEAKRLPIIQSGVAAELDARVALRGARSAEGLTGTITVEQGSARLPKLSTGKKLQSTGALDDVVFVDAEAKRKAAKQAREATGGPKATLVARIPGPFRVRAPELNADLQGTIELVVDGAGRLKLGGSAEAQEGTFELLGRRYVIERARVAFTGATPPNPALDLRLARQLPTTRVVVAVQGTLSQPTITLSSDPPIYDSSQVLAIVLGGDPDARTPRDQSRAEDRAVGALSGLIISKLRDQVLPGLPIDVLKVDTGPDGFGSTRLEVGKWIGDRVYVSYIHQFGVTTGIRRRNSNEGAVQYNVGHGLSINTLFGDAAVGALDLFWTLRF